MQRKHLTFVMKIFIFVLIVFGVGASYSTSAAVEHQAFFPNLLQRFTIGFGTVEGFVIEASTGNPLSNVPVCYEGICSNTNANGEYSLVGIPSGWQVISASRDNYNPLNQMTSVVANEKVILNFSLSYILNEGEYRIVLTWGAASSYYDPAGNPYYGEYIPNDMDAHLWIPNPGGTPDPLHVYWETKNNPDISNCDAFPFSCLENDVQDGSGPESILIVPLQPGIYTFAAQYYADYVDVNGVVPPLRESEAKVRVYDQSGLIKTYSVPTTGEGVWWHVFDVDGNDNGAIIDRNLIVADSPVQ